jgi:hypothetical protein
VQAVTFALYAEESGGAPLWIETQNVTCSNESDSESGASNADTQCHYMVRLGSMREDGLPQDLFTSNEARWLGVRVNGGEEQPRVLLVSVPYALKAADAETLGGKPISAFVLAPSVANSAEQTKSAGGDSGPAFGRGQYRAIGKVDRWPCRHAGRFGYKRIWREHWHQHDDTSGTA